MFSVSAIILIVVIYIGILIAVALWAEKTRPALFTGALAYALSLTAYTTTWTFYGSVGLAAKSGFLYLTIYFGPTLGLLIAWSLLRRMVKSKELQRVTSIADLISARYGKSGFIAALATLLVLFGTIPYVALQLKAMISSTAIIGGYPPSSAYSSIGQQIGPIIVLLMIIFTISFGIRRLTPTERHPGMIAVLTVESLVKLSSFLAAGIFIVYFVFSGFGDIFDQLPRFSEVFTLKRGSAQQTDFWRPSGTDFANWFTYIVLAFSAFFFLPRQFHLGVVENSDENHIRTAMWVVPLYLFAISFFVVPIAAAGLILGFNPVEADNLVLTLPLAAGNRWLSLFVCLGGLSAGIGMIMVETMTVSTMISNHLVLPLSSRFKALRGIQRHLLGTRWVAAALFITTGYVYERLFGPNYSLANIGLISFSAMLQLAPPIIAGMFWRKANKSGALLGLTAGFSIWLYCLIVPEFASIGWLPSALIEEGPFGLAFLRPGALFGLTAFNPLTHAVLWSLFLNISSLIVGSLLFTPSTEEEIDASRFVDALEIRPTRSMSNQKLPDFPVDSKRELIVELFSRYFNPNDAEQLTIQALRRAGFEATPRITVLQLASIRREIERTLAAAIGSPAAHAAIREQEFMTSEELAALSSVYSDILARLAVHPTELTSRIENYEERENILERDAGYSRLLARASQQLSSSLNMESTLATIVRFLIPETADGCVLVLSKPILSAPGSLVAHKDREKEARLSESLNSNELRESLIKIPESAYRKVFELSQSEITQLWGSSLLDNLPIRSASMLTLTSRGNVLGSLSLLSERPDQFRRPEEINLIEEYGHRCSTALDNAILYAASQEAIQAREDFLSIASHELRTPLTALRTQIQLLIRLSSLGKFDSLSPEKLNSMMVMADRQMDRLSRLIDELLDISRARRGDLVLSPSEIDFGHLVREIVERHQIELNQAKCGIELQLEKEVIGFWDRIRLEEVVANLLTNAMKYASGSLITVQLTGTEAGARLSVQDRGVGIHPKDQVRIFKPFQRATEKGQVRGFGLGLYIVHEIVKAHQGKLYLKSEPGKGSTFTIELPKYALKRTAAA